MQYVRSKLILSLFLLSTPSFAAATLKAYAPQDENIDAVVNYVTTVRPGQTLTLAAGIFESDGVQQNHSASDFGWQPSCDASSPGCPSVSAGSGVNISVNIPICMPLGEMVFKIAYPGLSPATVTLRNTEEPSVCPDNGNNNSYGDPYDSRGSLRRSRELGERDSFGGRAGGGGSGGGFGSGSGSGRSANGRGGKDFFSGGNYFGGGSSGGGGSDQIIDPYRPPAIVMQCGRGRSGQVVCRNVDGLKVARAQAARRQMIAQRKIAPQRMAQVKPKAKTPAKRVVKAKANLVRVVSR